MACAGRFAEARAACAAEMGRDDPNTAALWLYTLGRVLYDACELGPAVERLTDALQRPSPPGSAKGLLRSAQRLEAERAAGNGAFKRGEWANAAAAYTRALQARAWAEMPRARPPHLRLWPARSERGFHVSQVDPNHSRFNALLYCNRAAANGHRDGMLDQAR